MLFFALTLFFSIHKKWNLAKSGARNMASSLSNLVYNLAEGTHKVKCKDCDCFFFNMRVSMTIWKYKWLSCNKDYSSKLDKKSKKSFKNIFKFSDNETIKFILLFIIMSTWMNEKKLMKQHYLKKKNFIAT